jgi:hypothetical protein
MTEETQESQDSSIPAEQAEAPEIQQESEEVATPTLEDYNKLADTKKQLSARLAKAEAELKKVKLTPKTETNQTNTPPTLSREEAILFARGYTEQEVELASKLALVNKVSILEAVEDDYVKTKIEKRLQKERSEKASLGASSGNPRYQAEKPISQMTEEEHRAYSKKVMG